MLVLFLVITNVAFGFSPESLLSEITAAAEAQADGSGGGPGTAEEVAAPDSGQGAEDDESVAPDDEQVTEEDETATPDGEQSAEGDNTSAQDDGQGTEGEGTPAPDDGQGTEGEGTPAPDDGQGAEGEGTPAPGGGLDAEGEETLDLGTLPDETISPNELLNTDTGAEPPVELKAKAATGVMIYVGPRDPAVEADVEVIDLNSKVKKLSLYAVVMPEGSPQAVDWFITKNKAVSAKLSGTNCVLTGLKPGSVTVTARAKDGSGVLDTCTVTVAGLAKSITVSGPNELLTGTYAKYAAAVSPKGTTNKAVTWELDSEIAATIDPVTGMLTAKEVTEALTVMITATASDAGGVSSQPYPVIIRPAATDVTIMEGVEEADEALIDLNTKVKTLQLTVEVAPDGAFEAMNWFSSNPKVAKVSANGLVTGLKPGTATITAATKDGSGTFDTFLVTVAGLAKAITVSGPKEVVSGSSGQYAAAVSPKGTTNKTVTWMLDDESAASIDPDTGLLTAEDVDSATTVNITATATDGSEVASAPYQVSILPQSAGVVVWQSGITIDHASIHLNQSKSLTLSAEVLPSDARKGVKWSSTNPKVAKVDAKGVVTGVKTGQAVIRATAADGMSYKEIALTVDSGKSFQLEYNDSVTTVFADMDSDWSYIGSVTARNVNLKPGEHGEWSLELIQADDMDDPPATLYIGYSSDTYASINYSNAHGSGHVEYALRYQGGAGRYDQTVTIALDVVDTTPDELPTGISYPVTSLELNKGATYYFDVSKIAFNGGAMDGSVKSWRGFYLADAIYRNCAVKSDAYGGYRINFNKAGRYVVAVRANIGNRRFAVDIPIIVKDRGASTMALTTNLRYNVIYQDGEEDYERYLGRVEVSNFAIMDGERFVYSIAPVTEGPARISLEDSSSMYDSNGIFYYLNEGTGKSTYRITVKVQRMDENDEYVDTGDVGTTDITVDVRNLPGGLPTDVKVPKTNYTVKPGASLTFKYSDIQFGKGKLPAGVKVWKEYTTGDGWDDAYTQETSTGVKCTFDEPGIYVLYAQIGVGSYFREKRIIITVSDGSGIPLKLNVEMYYSKLYEDGDEQGTIAYISAKNISSDVNGDYEWLIERLGEGSADDDPVVLTLENEESDEPRNWVGYELTGGTGSVTYRVTFKMGDLSAYTDLTVTVSSSDGLPTGASVSQNLYEIKPGDSIFFSFGDIEFESGTETEDIEVWRNYDHDYDAWQNVNENYGDEGIRYTFGEKGRYILYAMIGIGNHSYSTPIEIDVAEEGEPILELDVNQYFSTVYVGEDYDSYLAKIRPRNFEINPASGEEYDWSVEQTSGSASVITAQIEYDDGDDYASLRYHLGSGTGSASFHVTLTVGEYEASADIAVMVVNRPASFPTDVNVPRTSYSIEPGDTLTFLYADITPKPVGAPVGAQVFKEYYTGDGPWDSTEWIEMADREEITFYEEGRYTLWAHLSINNLSFERVIVVTVGDSDELDPNLELEQDYDTIFQEWDDYEDFASIDAHAVLLGGETYEWDIQRIGGTSTGTINLAKNYEEENYLRLCYDNVNAGVGTAIFRVTYTAANGLYEGSVDLTLHIRSTAEFDSFPTGIDLSNFDTPYRISAGDTLTLDSSDLGFTGGDVPDGQNVWGHFYSDEGDWGNVYWDEDGSIYHITFNEPGTYTLNARTGFDNVSFSETGIEIIVS